MKREVLLAYLALAAVCLIWGTTYLVLRIAVLHFPPFLFTALRQITAGIIILAFILTIGKASLPNKSDLLRQAIAGFFMISLGNGLVAWSEMHIPSGVAAIICSLMPVLVILINITIHRDEKPTLPIIIGVTMGMLGVIAIFSEHLAEFSKGEYVAGILLTFTAVLSWAGGSIWIKRKNTTSNLFVNAGLQMLFGGLWLLPAVFLFDDLSTVTLSAEAVFSFLYLVAIGSVVAYGSYSYALRKLPMPVVSMYAYINPLVAVLLGWAVLDEKLNTQIWIAMVITIAGIYLVNRGYQLSARSTFKISSIKRENLNVS